jgi:hypothetical protein
LIKKNKKKSKGELNEEVIVELMLEEYVLILVKVLILALLGVYGVFAFLITRKIELMTKTVRMKDAHLIKGLGIINFVAAVVVLIMALILL